MVKMNIGERKGESSCSAIWRGAAAEPWTQFLLFPSVTASQLLKHQVPYSFTSSAFLRTQPKGTELYFYPLIFIKILSVQFLGL